MVFLKDTGKYERCLRGKCRTLFDMVEANILRSITFCRNHTPDMLPANHCRTRPLDFMYVIVQTAFNFAANVNTQFRSIYENTAIERFGSGSFLRWINRAARK